MGRKKFKREQGYREEDLIRAGVDHILSAIKLGELGFEGLDSAGYLGRLGIELLLKALLLHLADEFPDVHNLRGLIDRCAEEGVSLEFPEEVQETLVRLDDFDKLRYPNPTDGVSINADDIGALIGVFGALTKQFPESLEDAFEKGWAPDADGRFRKGGRYLMVKPKEAEPQGGGGRMTKSWDCPHCGKAVVMTPEIVDSVVLQIEPIIEGQPPRRAALLGLKCPNPECGEVTLKAHWAHWERRVPEVHGTNEEWVTDDQWQLVPWSSAKVFPEYVPEEIRRDYEEACAIVDLSPRASATLSRRCLQAILRDFYGAKGPNLFKEIESVEDKFEPEVLAAIKATKDIGNFGAHPEKDINTIVEVSPEDAAALIPLIEMLISSSYVQRENRRQQLREVEERARSECQAQRFNDFDA